MDPITREEMYLAAAAGYSVTPPKPVTRKELFLAKLAGMNVETPAAYTRQEWFLEMAAVTQIACVIEHLEVTENGTYEAPEGVAGYSPVVVNVAGSSADVRYVTFMSEDGTVEYGKKAVAVGDDCADPIARGVFATPTRESDVQYNYTFCGWATTPNGASDSNWNKSITEDKTVYANFVAAVRYYTITYYDSDGTTVLRTESISYGGIPNYTPVKTGYTFTGWSPELATVTGPASYTASWIEKLDFATLSWAKIAQYAESGEAANVFELGATKAFTTQQGVSVTAKIIGFNHDDLADGTGKAGITLSLESSFDNQYPITTSSDTGKYGANFHGSSASSNASKKWDDCNLRGYWNNTGDHYMLQYVLPADLVSVIKSVIKKIVYASTEYTTEDKIWLPSVSELGFSDGEAEGECYEIYTPGKTSGNSYPELVRYIRDKDCKYFTRSKYKSGVSAVQAIDATGKRATESQSSKSTGTIPHFCI